MQQVSPEHLTKLEILVPNTLVGELQDMLRSGDVSIIFSTDWESPKRVVANIGDDDVRVVVMQMLGEEVSWKLWRGPDDGV